MSDFPYAAEAEQEITVEELEYLESKYNSEKSAGDLVSPDTQFLYAWGLIRSKYTEDNKAGIDLLLQTMKTWPTRARECLYYLAVGNYRLREYRKASDYAQSLLQLEPTNLQAKSLLALIDSRSRRDGLIGMALVGGVAALTAGLVFSLIRTKSRD